MLNDITWKHFFIGIGIIAVVYYTIVILLFFRKELFNFLRGQGRPFRQAQLPELEDDEKLGARFENRLNESQESVSNDTSSARSDLMIGAVADLMQEIKALAHFITQNESSIEEAESFYKMLLSRYDQLVGTSYQHSINEALLKLLTEELLFSVTMIEIQSWWPKA